MTLGPQVLTEIPGRAAHIQYVERLAAGGFGDEVNREGVRVVFVARINNGLVAHRNQGAVLESVSGLVCSSSLS